MSERYKQILGEWYWKKKKNLLVHKCSETYKSPTQQIDSEISCLNCKEKAPQEIIDICLLCNIKSAWVYKTIKGEWLVRRDTFNSKSHLVHRCRGVVYPQYCNPVNCTWCRTKAPKHIIKYCKENNIGTL